MAMHPGVIQASGLVTADRTTEHNTPPMHTNTHTHAANYSVISLFPQNNCTNNMCTGAQHRPHAANQT